ncbi:phosphatase PAP2 family protein [Propioniciclava flava]|uniref:phosphatase PAP2 family protein n=1 Tax=Propioniciclava flava TaxID=2072026 RepID=UPI0013E9169F|nr:phosphatase PAP2 family protein [Propioniciclava flava]
MGPHLSNSFPSGHAALAWGATCALVLAPRTWLRGLALPVAAVGSLLISIGVVAAGWHRPSDVLGAALLAAAWGWGVHGLTLLGGRPSGSGRRGRRWATPRRG